MAKLSRDELAEAFANEDLDAINSHLDEVIEDEGDWFWAEDVEDDFLFDWDYPEDYLRDTFWSEEDHAYLTN